MFKIISQPSLKIRIPKRGIKLFNPSHRRIVFKENKKYGVLDYNFNEVIPASYQNISDFFIHREFSRFPIALAKYDGWFGIIDFEGYEVVAFEFKYIGWNENNDLVFYKD